MSASNTMETAVLKLYLQNVSHALVGDATGLVGSGTAGSLYISLHTSDPGETGDQTTNEAAYGAYARQAVARSTAGWDVTNDTGSNHSNVTFPTVTSTTGTITHFGIGTALSGAGSLLFSAALNTSLPFVVGTIPQFAAGGLTVTAA